MNGWKGPIATKRHRPKFIWRRESGRWRVKGLKRKPCRTKPRNVWTDLICKIVWGFFHLKFNFASFSKSKRNLKNERSLHKGSLQNYGRGHIFFLVYFLWYITALKDQKAQIDLTFLLVVFNRFYIELFLFQFVSLTNTYNVLH